MSERFEYKFLVGRGLGGRLVDDDGVDHGPLTQELLNRLGSEGWEVCSHMFCSQTQPSLIVKRRLAEQDSDRDTTP